MRKIILILLVLISLNGCYLFNKVPESKTVDKVYDDIHRLSDYEISNTDINIYVFKYKGEGGISRSGYWKTIKMP